MRVGCRTNNDQVISVLSSTWRERSQKKDLPQVGWIDNSMINHIIRGSRRVNGHDLHLFNSELLPIGFIALGQVLTIIQSHCSHDHGFKIIFDLSNIIYYIGGANDPRPPLRIKKHLCIQYDKKYNICTSQFNGRSSRKL